jgi:peptidyl-prolyl cis-trans isomerase C
MRRIPMSSKKTIALLMCVSAGMALIGCDLLKPKQPPKPVAKQEEAATVPVRGTLIAKVNNYPVTLEEMNDEIDNYNNAVPADQPQLKVTSKDQKVDYLKNDMVRRILLYQEGLDRGLERKDEIQRALEKTKMELVVMELIKEEANKVEVSSAEIEDYYNKFKDQLKEPEERQIREIVVSTEQEARDILITILQGADFATTAKERSKLSNAKDGGDMGFVQKGKNPAQFDSVAFSDTLDVGKVSNYFKGADGYYILKIEAKRGGKQKPLSEIWDDIKKGLTFLKQQQKVEELIQKLSRQAKIEIYEGEIK